MYEIYIRAVGSHLSLWLGSQAASLNLEILTQRNLYNSLHIYIYIYVYQCSYMYIYVCDKINLSIVQIRRKRYLCGAPRKTKSCVREGVQRSSVSVCERKRERKSTYESACLCVYVRACVCVCVCVCGRERER